MNVKRGILMVEKNRKTALKRMTDKTKNYRKNNPDLWTDKLWISAKRVLSSMIFYISGNSALESKNYLLPPIAYYYSLFHLSKALLFILPTRDLEKDKGIPHKRVVNLIDSEFIQRKLLDEDYLEEVKYYLELRESVNYSVDGWANLDSSLIDNQSSLSNQIKNGIDLYRVLCLDDLHYPRSVIGDGIGDDICATYLSKKEQKDLWNLAMDLDITT